MINNVLTNIDGIGLYGIISIVIFFGFFSGMLIWAFALKQSHLQNMGKLPIEEGELPYDANRKS
jgi:cytochrome c oxidase cbb3-type subunit IV